VHVCDCALGRSRVLEQNVGRAAVRHELPVHGHVDVSNATVGAEDFAQVCLVDVFGEFFDDDFGAAGEG